MTTKTLFYLSRFFFNDTATTEIYTLSLHDALPICSRRRRSQSWCNSPSPSIRICRTCRSEEHTSELQSRQYRVCSLLLEKKTKLPNYHPPPRAPTTRTAPATAHHSR